MVAVWGAVLLTVAQYLPRVRDPGLPGALMGLPTPIANAAAALLFGLYTGALVAGTVLLNADRAVRIACALGLLFGVLGAPFVPATVAGIGGGLLLAIIIALTAAARYLADLQVAERAARESEPYWQSAPNADAVALREASILGRHNHLLSLTEVKPGRGCLLQCILWLVKKSVAWFGTRGELSGITTIHFARWVVLPGGQWLFLSNYDGAWEAYLDEFIDDASTGLSAIWSNTVGFPITHWLLGGGARAAHRFKMFARNSHYPTAYYYSAYPTLNVGQIKGAIALREILHNDAPSDADCDQLARML